MAVRRPLALSVTFVAGILAMAACGRSQEGGAGADASARVWADAGGHTQAPLAPAVARPAGAVPNAAGTPPAHDTASPPAKGGGAAGRTAGAGAAADVIYGTEVPRAESWRVAGGRIHRGDEPVRLRGVNWFGLETPERAPHGLWTGRSIADVLAQVAQLGFNALRVPVSPEAVRPDFPAADSAVDGACDTGRDMLDAVVAEAGRQGLYVLLDLHTCDPHRGHGSAASPVACSGYTKRDWLDDLERLADIAHAHAHVAGIDLFNEPHGLTWAEWRRLAAAGGETVLRTNPRVLVFVEGVGNASANAGWSVFWGENFVGAGTQPPDLPASRLVYSPHVYGPSVAPQAYFDAPDFPANMPAIWNAHFGHLRDRGVALAIGEFGGWYDDARVDGSEAWQRRFVRWLQERNIRDFFYWALNPNAGDTGGLLQDDWQTPVQRKLELLAPLMEMD